MSLSRRQMLALLAAAPVAGKAEADPGKSVGLPANACEPEYVRGLYYFGNFEPIVRDGQSAALSFENQKRFIAQIIEDRDAGRI